jgi:hypothetical protein
MSQVKTGEPAAEEIQFSDRYYIQTAKNAIESVVHIFEEAISNEDEAISRRAKREGGKDEGRITIVYDPDAMRLTVIGDGDGMTAAVMRERLKKVGDSPQEASRRGFFHRGIREVFLAMGGGEVTSIGMTEDGREVLSQAVFQGTPTMTLELEDEEVPDELRAQLGLEGTGSAVSIPVGRFARKKTKQFEPGRLAQQIRDCVGLRPVLIDPAREVVLEYGATPPQRLVFEYPEGDELVAERKVEVGGLQGTLWAKLTEKPVKRAPGRRARIAGILIRGERAAYEVSSGNDLSVYPALARVVGELRLDGIEELQRQADDDSQLVYKTDRSGLNPEHPVVEAACGLIDEVLQPLISDLDANRDRTKSNPDMRRELQKLARVINQVVDGGSPVGPDDKGGKPSEDAEPSGEGGDPPPQVEPEDRQLDDPIEFPYSRAFVKAGEGRLVKIWFDAAELPEGSPVEVTSAADEYITQATLSADSVPAPAPDGVSELTVKLKGGNSEGRHELTVRSGAHEATLPVHVRFPRASGFISNIIPEYEDWPSGSAIWDPSTGVVKVKVGRPEFKDAEAQARRNGNKDPWKDPLYRQLVVESVREAALWEAAKRRAEVEWDELSEEDRRDGRSFHNEVKFQFQELDYLLRAKLLKAFAQS